LPKLPHRNVCFLPCSLLPVCHYLIADLNQDNLQHLGLLKIHLGDQTDGKALLGTYVCTDVPGEFKWQPGVLTRAVEEGQWILIEDIDLAPSDVISILVPLLESRELFIPSRGQKIKASPGFQLFATQTLFSAQSSPVQVGGNLWTKVRVEPFSNEELGHVISILFPSLSPFSGQLIEIYLSSSNPSLLGSLSSQGFHSGHLRKLSVRDLLKFCERIHRIFEGRQKFVTAEVKERMFLEALDCFCAMIPKATLRQHLADAIGSALSLSPEKVFFFFFLNFLFLYLLPSCSLPLFNTRLLFILSITNPRLLSNRSRY